MLGFIMSLTCKEEDDNETPMNLLDFYKNKNLFIVHLSLVYL